MNLREWHDTLEGLMWATTVFIWLLPTFAVHLLKYDPQDLIVNDPSDAIRIIIEELLNAD